MIRVGVTGHRDLADETDLVRQLTEAVRSIRSSATPAPLDVDDVEIWSSLAEGADRLAAELVPVEAGHLVAILPLEPEEYRADFATQQSVDQFDRLVATAERVEVTGPDAAGSRESAYERAGQRVIQECDVLLALWDGEASRGRGGTAQMVTEARRLDRQVVVIPTERSTE